MIVYKREPLRLWEGIPVFSESNAYIDNYRQIAADHTHAMQEQAANPWIEEELWRAMEATTAQLVQRYAAEGSTILDVGVGLGRLLSRFPALRRYGMDISEDYLQIARKAGIDVCLAQIEDMPYRQHCFDTIVCTDVLEHVLDLNAAVRCILDVLRPGGVLIVRVPNREDLSRYLAPDYPYQLAHLRTFDEASLRLLFEKIFGLRFLEATPGACVVETSLLRYRVPMPRWPGIASRLVSWSRAASARAGEAMLQKLYHPITVNIVLRKPQSLAA